MQLEQNINLISSSLPGCLEMDSGAAGKEYSCAVYFLTDLISIITSVETWLGAVPPLLTTTTQTPR